MSLSYLIILTHKNPTYTAEYNFITDLYKLIYIHNNNRETEGQLRYYKMTYKRADIPHIFRSLKNQALKDANKQSAGKKTKKRKNIKNKKTKKYR